MKKRLFLFALVFSLMFTSSVFGARKSTIDELLNWEGDFYLNIPSESNYRSFLSNIDNYPYFVFIEKSNGGNGLHFSDIPFVVDADLNDYLCHGGNSVELLVDNYGRLYCKFRESSTPHFAKIISSNYDIVYENSDDVFFSPPRPTPLQKVAPEIFPLVKKQVGGITLGTVCLISVPILLILLGRLFRRWLTL